jgi:hypothetical protein
MPRPDITGIAIGVNMRGRKKNFFTLRGTNFDAARATLRVVDQDGTVWESAIIRGQSSATRLVCWVRTPRGFKGVKTKRGFDIETLDITVTNPDTTDDTQHEDVDVVDEPNP